MVTCKYIHGLTNRPLCIIATRKGYSSSDIVVDITSGTKIMSAAIASLSVLYRLYSIIYVGGGLRNENGTVIQGTERPREMKPLKVLYKHDLNLIKDYFPDISFRLAIRSLKI